MAELYVVSIGINISPVRRQETDARAGQEGEKDAEAVDSLSVTHRCKRECRLESKQCHYKVPLQTELDHQRPEILLCFKVAFNHLFIRILFSFFNSK